MMMLTSGLPADIQLLVDQIDAEAIQYPDRASSLKRLHDLASNGDFDRARRTATKIIEQQQQLKNANGSLPADIQLLVNQIDAETIQYPDRASSLKRLHDLVSNGDFDRARHTATKIIEQQQQLNNN